MGHLSDNSHKGYLDGSIRTLLFNRNKIFGPYVNPGARALDAGCGAGFNTIGIARLAGDKGEVVAVDINEKALEVVNSNAKKNGLGSIIRTEQCTEDSLCVEGGYDFVNAWWMVHETRSEAEFVSEVYELMNPGGRFFIAEPKFHVKQTDFDNTLKAAEKAGFTLVKKPRIFMSMAAVLGK